MDEEYSIAGAKAFAKTLLRIPFAEALGQLILAFDMDIVSAKALMWLVYEGNKK